MPSSNLRSPWSFPFIGCLLLVAALFLAACGDGTKNTPSGSASWMDQIRMGALGSPYPPVLVEPAGAQSSGTVTFIWAPYNIDLQQTFRLWVSGVHDHTYSWTDAQCSLSCRVTLTLPANNYTWYVLESSTNLWGGPLAFSVPGSPPPADAPSSLSPNGSAKAIQVFSWAPVSGATSYRVWIEGVLDQTLPSGSFGCSPTCQTTDIALPEGVTATWYVRGLNATGPGPWAGPATYAVSGAAPPSVPLLAPHDGGTFFEWGSAAMPTSFRLWVEGVADQTVVATDALLPDGGYRSPSIALVAGTSGSWYVQGIDSSGRAGAWSAPGSFSISGTPPPPAPDSLEPSGPISSGSVGFAWTGSGSATKYRLWIEGLIDMEIAADTCGPGYACSVTTLVPVGQRTWYVEAINDTGGTWAGPISINAT